MNIRRPIYEKLADVKIGTDSVKPQEVAEQIVKWLSNKGE
jgi:shikimate kinase